MLSGRIIAVFTLPLVTAGCVTASSVGNLTDPAIGFRTVAARAEKVTGKQTVWAQSSEEAQAAAERVKALVRGKTIGPDVAVQVALLNNKGLQASYAEVGLSAADLYQETLLVNPTVSLTLTGFGVPQTIEGAIVNNIFAATTRQRRVAVAEARFRQAQLRAAEQTLALAAETRRAWIRAVSAWEAVTYLAQAQTAADAASDLAQRLGQTGAFSKTEQGREHVFYAEIVGQAAEARLAARGAKEELTRQMGLWGADLDYKIPNALPPLPKSVSAKRAVEAEALNNRVDLEVSRLELDALAKSYGLTQATRYVTDLQLLSGLEVARDETEDGKETAVSPVIGTEFTIPVFDTGKARLRKAELAYMQAANLTAERAVNIRSEARAAYDAYRSTYQIARHYRDSVLPLRKAIEAQSVLTYNGMITSTFELLADTRAKISSIQLSLDAKRNFWLASVDLGAAIHGGGSASGGDEALTSRASSSDKED
jgi:outer membrane protein TolC